MKYITKLVNLLFKKKHKDFVIEEDKFSTVVDSSDNCIQGTCLIGEDVISELFNGKEYVGEYIELIRLIDYKSVILCVLGDSGYNNRTLCNPVDLFNINCDIDLDVLTIRRIGQKKEEE